MLVTNQVASNGGDAAIALGIQRQILDAFGADTEITFADSNPEIGLEFYPDLTFMPLLQRRFAARADRRAAGVLIREANIARFVVAARIAALRPLLLRTSERAELETYASYDLVISTGGTYLVENYRIWPRLAELRVVLSLGIPLVLFTQSLGPFRSRYNRFWMRSIVGRAAAVLVRDAKSAAHVRELGVTTDKIRQLPDVAFSLEVPARPAPRTPPAAIISVRDWPLTAGGATGIARYEDSVAALATELVTRHGMTVAFVSTCQGISGYRDDSATAERIVARLAADVRVSVTVDGSWRSPRQLQELLAGTDLAICTRMHMAILALTVGTPVLAIAYEFKTTELFESMGLGAHVIDIDAIERVSAVEALRRVLASPSAAAAVAVLREETNEGVQILRGAIV